VPEAATAIAGLRLLLALVFAFLLFRRLGLGEGPAFFGSVAYGFGGFLVLWLGWPMADTAAGLPLLLYALLLVARRGARSDALLLAVAVYGVAAAGHPETILYAGLLAGAFGLWCLTGSRGRPPRARRAPGFASCVGAGLVAAACAAPVLLPTAGHLPRTHRAELVDRRAERIGTDDPFEGLRGLDELGVTLRRTAGRIAPMVAPHSQGSQLHGAGETFWGEGNVYLYTTGFAGTLTLLLVLAAAGPGGRRMPLERPVLWIGVPFVVLAVVRFPGLAHLLATAPVLDRVANRHARLTMVLVLFLAYLAACTLERWRRGELRRASLIGAAAGTLALVVAAHLAPAPEGFPAAASLAALRHRALALQVAVAGVGLAALLAASGGFGGRERDPIRQRARRWDWARAAVPAGLGLVAFLELWCFFAPANPAAPRRLFYPATDAIRWLREHDGPYRVAGLADALRPNVPSVYGLADPRFSNPAKPWDYAFLTSPLSRSVREITDVFGAPEHPLYRLLGVRYLLIRDEIPLDPLRRVFEGDGLSIYRPPAPPLPRLFLPEAAERRRPAWLQQVLSSDDHGRLSVADALPGGAQSWRSRRPAASALEIHQPARSPARLRARALLQEPRLLASSIHQDGHWHLLVDGVRVETVRTNGVFVGAWLGPGEHRLDLLYRPRSVVLGSILAALGAAAALAWWLPEPRSRRSRPPRSR
jgi:hypothetical protein